MIFGFASHSRGNDGWPFTAIYQVTRKAENAQLEEWLVKLKMPSLKSNNGIVGDVAEKGDISFPVFWFSFALCARFCKQISLRICRDRAQI